jgi:hypothetical protein
MIIRRTDDKTTAMILYRSGSRMISGTPESYQAVNLAE